jgi:hypothetical protein
MIPPTETEDTLQVTPTLEKAWLQLSKWLFALGILSMIGVAVTAFYYLATLITFYQFHLNGAFEPGLSRSGTLWILFFFWLITLVIGVKGSAHLFKFSRELKAALLLKEQIELESAWLHFKKHLRLTGILMIGYWVLGAIVISVGNYYFRL